MNKAQKDLGSQIDLKGRGNAGSLEQPDRPQGQGQCRVPGAAESPGWDKGSGGGAVNGDVMEVHGVLHEAVARMLHLIPGGGHRRIT